MGKLLSLDEETAKLIKSGSVGIIPTDTVYGLAASAADRHAAAKLYALKSRENKPGTLIAASIDQLVDLGIKRRYLKAVEHYWPDAISVVVPCGPELRYLHGGLHSLPVRIPKDEELAGFLKQTGPLLTTSANPPGLPEAKTISESRKYFGDKADFYVDGGDLSGRKPSTVIRIVDDAIEVLRQGAVKIDENGRITQ